MKLFEVGLLVFLFNVPFGYWRSNVKKFSLRWILAIHLPVPFIVTIRFLSGIGFAFITYPVLVTAFFGGQYTGAKIQSWWKNNLQAPATSCLPCDLLRIFNTKFF